MNFPLTDELPQPALPDALQIIAIPEIPGPCSGTASHRIYSRPAFRSTDSVIRNSLLPMIRSFACPDTEALFHSRPVVRWKSIERVARRKLLQLQAATELASLRVPPGNRLEALRGDRKGQHSIRIYDQWRVCFIWRTDGPHQVEIVDYH